MRALTHFLRWSVGLAAADTQTTALERDCLARLAAGRQRVVEIGVWHGVTTTRLRAAMAPNGLLLAVDPYPRGRLGVSLQRIVARREVGRVANARVQWVRLTGAEAAAWYAASGEPPVDLVFIDGDHGYDVVRADWEGWSPLVADGGVVALHDSRPTADRPIHDAGSVRFTNGVILGDPRFELLEVEDSLTALRRRANR